MISSVASYLKYLFIIIVFLSTSCQTKQHPFSYDFEMESDLNAITWKCKTLLSLSDKYVTSGKKSLKLQLYPSPYPGLTIENFNPDWSEYHFLDFDVYNPENTPLKLALRIDDRPYPSYGDRYNNTIVINPRTNHISISLDYLHTSETERKLNLSSIKKFIIFMVDPTEKHTIYLDNLRVE